MGGSVALEKRALFSLLNVLSALYLYEVNKPSQSQKNRQTAALQKLENSLKGNNFSSPASDSLTQVVWHPKFGVGQLDLLTSTKEFTTSIKVNTFVISLFSESSYYIRSWIFAIECHHMYLCFLGGWNSWYYLNLFFNSKKAPSTVLLSLDKGFIISRLLKIY